MDGLMVSLVTMFHCFELYHLKAACARRALSPNFSQPGACKACESGSGAFLLFHDSFLMPLMRVLWQMLEPRESAARQAKQVDAAAVMQGEGEQGKKQVAIGWRLLA